MERKGREHLLPKQCPRCESTNTKFCYYNNYSQSQPRHYCKACRRYWTEGGTLRNVPQGGGGGSSRRGSKRQKKTSGLSTPTPPHGAVAPVPAGLANRTITAMTAGPEEALLMHPPPAPPFFFMGGGIGEGVMGLQGGNECGFHPGADIVAGIEEQSAMMPLMLSPPPGFINFPVPQHQQNLLPPNMMIHPAAPMSSVASFTAATTGPSATDVAAGYDGEGGFWNVFGSGGGGCSGFPPPPTSSGPF